jgi:hypothetical protein
MTGSYAAEHADALADVSDAGAAVVFTRTVNVEDTATGLVTPSVSTIAGSAIRVKGNPDKYQALGLVQSQAPSLFFTPNNYGDCPGPGDTVLWRDPVTQQLATYAVKDVDPIAPDGFVIAARVVIAK